VPRTDVLDAWQVGGDELQLRWATRASSLQLIVRTPRLESGVSISVSQPKALDATSLINPTYAVAWGVVSREVRTAEVRNDDGEAFPARIMSVPGLDALRAAWGIAYGCEWECELVGYSSDGKTSWPHSFPVARRAYLEQDDDSWAWKLWVSVRSDGDQLEYDRQGHRGSLPLAGRRVVGPIVSMQDVDGFSFIGSSSLEGAGVDAVTVTGERIGVTTIPIPSSVGPGTVFLGTAASTLRRVELYGADGRPAAAHDLER
jgi:hypothetical protein